MYHIYIYLILSYHIIHMFISVSYINGLVLLGKSTGNHRFSHEDHGDYKNNPAISTPVPRAVLSPPAPASWPHSA